MCSTLQEEACYVAFNPTKEEDIPRADEPYKLPDGTAVMLGAERFRAPEVLFNPDVSILLYSILRSSLHCIAT
jgi:centractin